MSTSSCNFPILKPSKRLRSEKRINKKRHPISPTSCHKLPDHALPGSFSSSYGKSRSVNVVSKEALSGSFSTSAGSESESESSTGSPRSSAVFGMFFPVTRVAITRRRNSWTMAFIFLSAELYKWHLYILLYTPCLPSRHFRFRIRALSFWKSWN